MASIVALPYRAFPYFVCHMIQSGSLPDNFKAGLTQMTSTNCAWMTWVTLPGFNAVSVLFKAAVPANTDNYNTCLS